MANKAAGQIMEFGGQVEKIAGKKASEKVMEGSDKIIKSADKEKIAVWMKEVIDRLDACAAPGKCKEIMTACGHNCIAHNKGLADGIKNRRLKYKTEEEFLKAEIKNRPVKGIRLELKGKILYHYYAPKNNSRPRRCYCSMMNALPKGTNVSLTYCNCSRGFVEKYWEGALGRPVEVEVVETSLTGAEECKFIIHL